MSEEKNTGYMQTRKTHIIWNDYKIKWFNEFAQFFIKAVISTTKQCSVSDLQLVEKPVWQGCMFMKVPCPLGAVIVS